MSYIQIEIGGELRGLKFNNYAIRKYRDVVDLNDFEGTLMYALIWGGLKANCYVKQTEFIFDYETVVDWVDQLSPETILKVYECFATTQQYKDAVEIATKKDNEPLTKKKLNTKTTKP